MYILCYYEKEVERLRLLFSLFADFVHVLDKLESSFVEVLNKSRVVLFCAFRVFCTFWVVGTCDEFVVDFDDACSKCVESSVVEFRKHEVADDTFVHQLSENSTDLFFESSTISHIIRFLVASSE